MGETQPKWLGPRTAQLVAGCVEALRQALGDELEAALLVGTAMNPAHQQRARTPEVLAIVADGALDFTLVARALAGPMSDGARVRLVTHRELERSCDVFALEIAEWKARHHVLHGDDPLAALTTARADLRRGIETELRGLGRRIKNRVLTGLATNERRDDPRQAVVDGVDRLLVAAHHLLALVGDEPPTDEPGLLRALATKCKADAGPLVDKLASVRSGDTKFDPLGMLGALLAVVDPATDFVDALEVDP